MPTTRSLAWTALAGPLGGLGPDLHLGGVITLFPIMCVGYAALLRWGGRLPAAAVLGAVLALHVLMALGPPLLSADVFSYGAYGRMSVPYHVNPYVLGPSSIDKDVWYRFVSAPWVATPTAYGPLFTAISDGLARLPTGAATLGLLGVSILSTYRFGSGPLHLLGTLEVIQTGGGPQSVPGRIAAGLGLGQLSRGVVTGLPAGLVLTVAGLLFAVRRQRLDWITATGWAIAALLLTSTFLLPWYVVWLLPFAALSRSRGLQMASLAFTAIGMASL